MDRVLVCGSRNWTNKDAITNQLKTLAPETIIVSGGARGADTLAAEAARELGLQVEEFHAAWETEGKAAGILRNLRMLNTKPSMVLAFGASGPGTSHTVGEAKRRGIRCWVIE